jgi:hypothetical protein
MGFNEYAADSLLYGEDALGDDDHTLDDGLMEPLDPESWQDWHSEDLLNMWMSIRQYKEERYICDRATFNSFCEWAYKYSSY